MHQGGVVTVVGAAGTYAMLTHAWTYADVCYAEVDKDGVVAGASST